MASPETPRDRNDGSTETVEDGNFEKERLIRDDGRYVILYSFPQAKDERDPDGDSDEDPA